MFDLSLGPAAEKPTLPAFFKSMKAVLESYKHYPEDLFILRVEATLPSPASLELTARLTQGRPFWDVEPDASGFILHLSLKPEEIDQELGYLERCCQALERVKHLEVDLMVRRRQAVPHQRPPAVLGAWAVHPLAESKDGKRPIPRPDRLYIPADLSCSARLWNGEHLLAQALVRHLTPPPGAPNTRGRPALFFTGPLPLSPTAAILGGVSEVVVVSEDKGALARAERVASLNGRSGALEARVGSFEKMAGETGWNRHFGLIAVHLSPYTIGREMKRLFDWLAPGGCLLIAGFSPGPQTAFLLRAAAKAGFNLTGSATSTPDDSDAISWAAIALEAAAEIKKRPPLNWEPLADLEMSPESIDELSPALAEALETADDSLIDLGDEEGGEDSL